MTSDKQGHVYAVWWTKHRDGTKDVLVSTSRDFGGSFGPAVKLNRDDGAFPPEINADAAGHVYVVWQDARDGGWDIYLNKSMDFGKTWHVAGVRLNTGSPGEAEARFPEFGLDGHGTLAVVWQEDRGVEQQEGIYLT